MLEVLGRNASNTRGGGNVGSKGGTVSIRALGRRWKWWSNREY